MANNSQLKIADPDTLSDEMLPEYRFDYSKAQPNRFVQRDDLSQTIHLDDDVAAVFTTEASVNAVLRALIQTMPPASGRESP